MADIDPNKIDQKATAGFAEQHTNKINALLDGAAMLPYDRRWILLNMAKKLLADGPPIALKA